MKSFVHCTHSLQGVRIEVETGGLQTWAESGELEAVLAPLSLSPPKKLSTEELVREELMAEERCKIAFAAVQVSALTGSL